jgi:hypothetical protein
MKPKKRQKLCHHCEGDVDLDVIVCPFCAADLREERPEQPKFSPSTANIKQLNTEQALYPPPYQQRQVPEPEEIAAEETAVASTTEESAGGIKALYPTVGPILLFALGAQLFFLAVAFLLLSDRGTLILQFNANWWPLCLILSIPLLVLGYRFVKDPS